MKIHIEKQSTIPIQVQIKQRIKIGLNFGELRPGDTLPSIRELEKELGVGRAIIRSAYLDLKDSGLLTITQGKRVVINEGLSYRPDESFLRSLEKLVDNTLKQARSCGVCGSSYAKFLLQRVLEHERRSYSYLFVAWSKSLACQVTEEISKIWQIPLHGVTFEEFRSILHNEHHHISKVFVSYYRYDGVCELLKEQKRDTSIDLIPVSLRFRQEMVAEIKALPPHSTVLLITDDADFAAHGQAFADAYKEAFHSDCVNFIVGPWSSIKNLTKLARSNKYQLIIVSNRIWDTLSEDFTNVKAVTHPKFEVDRTSLEQARLKAGIIV